MQVVARSPLLPLKLLDPEGKVIGVDCNPEMLALARKHQPTVAQKLGYDNIEFRHGMIQDLSLDLDLLDTELQRQPIVNGSDWHRLRSLEAELRQTHPLGGRCERRLRCLELRVESGPSSRS